MQLKASTDYALRAVIYLAMEGGVVSSKKIAEDIAVPRDYLIQLSQLLRNAGIIEARAGKNGGYVLAKDPSQVSFLDVVNAIDDSVRPAKGADFSEETPAKPEDAPVVHGLRAALEVASSSFDAYLDSITVDMLAACAKDAEHAKDHLQDGVFAEGEHLEAQTVERNGFCRQTDTVAAFEVFRSGKPQELHDEQGNGQHGNSAHQRPHEDLSHALQTV